MRNRIIRLAKKVKAFENKKKSVKDYELKKYPGTKTDVYMMDGDMPIDSKD